MKLWYTNNFPFTSYTTLTPHSDSRSAYVTSHVQYTTYKIIATCIERATALRANNMRVTRGIKQSKLFTTDKLISGSSLEDKEAIKLGTLKLFCFR